MTEQEYNKLKDASHNKTDLLCDYYDKKRFYWTKLNGNPGIESYGGIDSKFINMKDLNPKLFAVYKEVKYPKWMK